MKEHNPSEETAAKFVDQYLKEGLQSEASSALESTEQRIERRKKEVAELLGNHQKIVKEGLEYFKKYDAEQDLADILERVEKYALYSRYHVESPLTEDDFEKLFTIVLDVYNHDELQTTSSMCSFMTQLFPFQAQPYIIQANIQWRQFGIERAVSIYENIVKLVKSPLLYTYAAACFKSAGMNDKARDILVDALWLCSDNPQSFAPLIKEIEDDIKALQ